jgi:hypothetical protein
MFAMSATHRPRPAVLGWLSLVACLTCLLADSPAAAAGGAESAAAPPPLVVASESASVTVLVDDVPGAGDVAAPPTGQTLYVIDEDGHGVVAVDPFDPGRRWMAVAAARTASPADRSPVPTAIGCIDSATLALACRLGNQWVLRTHRLKPPGSAADPAAPLQSLSLGTAAPADSPAAVQLAVSHSRNWLVVAGLPAPLPAVTRAAIEGARLAAASPRHCPEIPSALRPAAVSVSPLDELVLFVAPGAGGSAAETFLSFHSPLGPQRLLHVATGLTNVRDAAFCRGDGSLWVVAGEKGSETQPEGLWRIDAVMREFRQAVQAVCVAKLPAPRSVVCLSERAIVVTHGTGPRRVVRIDPSPAVSGQHQP